MEIIINELSLIGQFEDENNFFDSFDCVLRILKIIDELKFTLSKEHNLFKSKITDELIFRDVLKLRSDRARRMKRFVSKLVDSPPFWNENKKHNCDNDKYIYNSKNICNTSLAESCERDKIIISFKHSNFSNKNLEVQKNSINIDIFNIMNKDDFLEYLLEHNKIKILDYCNLKFKNSNLDFSKIENKKEFTKLDDQQQKEFIKSFKQFSKMKWFDIEKHDGFKYKQTNGIFHKNKKIHKFRVTQKYRCFGYRENDKFFILKIEINHKISDKA
jgi:hypothetical protein